MATAAQVNANRLNAKLSTGPRTEEGKSRTKYNAVTHGYYATVALLPGERMEQWHSFCTAYVEDKAPVGLPQILSIEQAAVAEWKLIKLNYIEAKTCEEAGPDQTLAEFQGEYTYEDDMCKKQVQRIENHLIHVRDKHLAQFRLHKKDKADEAEEPRKPKTSRQKPVAATIPVAVQPDPIVDATSSGGTPAAEVAGVPPEELARRQAIREETEKFREYLNTRRYGYSEAQISQEIQDHLIEIGLVVDSPQVEAN